MLVVHCRYWSVTPPGSECWELLVGTGFRHWELLAPPGFGCQIISIKAGFGCQIISVEAGFGHWVFSARAVVLISSSGPVGVYFTAWAKVVTSSSSEFSSLYFTDLVLPFADLALSFVGRLEVDSLSLAFSIHKLAEQSFLMTV